MKPTENKGVGAYYAVPVTEDGAVNVSVEVESKETCSTDKVLCKGVEGSNTVPSYLKLISGASIESREYQKDA